MEYPCKLLVSWAPCLLLHEDVNLATPNSQKGEGAQQQTPVPCQQKSGPLLWATALPMATAPNLFEAHAWATVMYPL